MKASRWRTALTHLGLFVLSVGTTIVAGAEQAKGKMLFFNLTVDDLWAGIPYSIAFLLFLSVHEFGHYFTAIYHKVKTSLPYYIPIYLPFISVLNIGSFGAVIRLRQTPPTRRAFFDIGVAGPLAGFVVSVGLLVYGISNLPDAESYIYSIHPEYKTEFGHIPTENEQRTKFFGQQMLANADSSETTSIGLFVNTNLLMELLVKIVPHNPANMPSGFELIHYPFLFVGFLTLFFTALNLLPIGQLDGGHVVYGLFGPRVAGIVSRITVLLLLLAGGTGLLDVLHLQDTYLDVALYATLLIYVLHRMLGNGRQWQAIAIWAAMLAAQIAAKYALPDLQPSPIWLLYAFFAVRMIGLDHPISQDERPLNPARKVLGWLAILIFVLCFTPNPIDIVGL